MRDSAKVLSISAGVLFALFIIARLTNMFQYYHVPTSGNYPTIKAGEYVFASNLIKPKRFSMICYHPVIEGSEKEVYVQRLCGMEGDKVEIRNGELFINDAPSDGNLTLAHSYISSRDVMEALGRKLNIDDILENSFSPDSACSNLSDADVKKLKSTTVRRLFSQGIDPAIEEKYHQPWNQDHFGPVVVPAGKYFLLGDSRNNSADSRYQGFIDKSRYVSTLIGK